MSGGTGRGFYDVEGLGRGSSDAPLLIQGIDYTQSAIVQQVVTLESTKILYTFGLDFGNMTVYGEILLGPAGGQSHSAFSALRSFFEQNQVAATQTSIRVSAPSGSGFDVFLQGLAIGRVDPEFHVQPFVLIGIIAATNN